MNTNRILKMEIFGWYWLGRYKTVAQNGWYL
jgi:hypothetical protein